MAEFVTLQQGDPVVVLNDTATPTIVTQVELEEVVIASNGAVIEVHNGEPPVTDLLAQYILLSR